MCQCKLSLLCVSLCFCVFTVTAFNVDSFNYASYETPYPDGHNSMFGFSVALHRERNNGWLIVGAPEAQSNQPGVIHGGAVYKCPTNRDGGCEEIPFDTTGHNRDARNNLMDNKTEQWFGATVSSSGREEGPIVACAPRYTWFPNGRTRRDPVGTCYVSNGFFADFNEYSPCRTYQWGYHRQGSCQAGFSAAINKVGDRLFIGSPGSWYWQGQMYSIDAHATFDFKPSLFSATYGHEGQVHQQSLETRPAVFSTTEGTEKDDDSYMGYSTIAGDFLGNGEEGIAVGMPRGNDLRGKVLLFTWNLTNFLHHFTSDQIGSYYGYALAAVDVDGDSKLDLIVGAPMYTVQNNKDKYDVGRVYVIYHQGEKGGKFVNNYIIDGFNSKSRFGQALASLGDINQDGFGDFAVGAPYDGKDNRGAVYIYHGSSKGVRKKFSQVIFAEDVIPLPTGALTTFGFSITGGLDLDGNQYPDMAVGAYLSNRAFFFRSRPVIKVDASVKFLSTSVNILNNDYTLRSDGTPATKTQFQFCSKYYGKGIPSSLNLGVEYILDTKKLINPRMGFVDDEGQNRKNTTIVLSRDEQVKCAPPIDVYVRSDIRDKLTALVVEAKYWLKDDVDLSPSYLHQLPRNPRATLIPVLDLNSPPSKKDSINIQKNCGDDDVCIPNLDVTVEPSVREFYLDSGGNFFLDITVSNSGEDAFEATVEVKYPDGFFYATSSDVQVVSHVLCSSGENNTITCDIGNPVPFNKVVHFKLFWQPDYSKELPSKLSFDVSVNSTNEELPETRMNNKRTVEISILYDVIQEIRGWSIPSEVLFSPASSLYADDISNQTSYTASKDRLSEDVIGPQVIHVYELKNGGKTTIKATEIFFVWPSTTSTGEDFLYLIDPPHFSFTEGLNLKCGPIPANYRDFEVSTRRKTIWELYDINIFKYSKSEKFFINETSQGVGVQKGGTIVKENALLNKAVETGDSSKAMNVRHQNKTQEKTMTWQDSMKVQIFEGGVDVSDKLRSGNFRRSEIGGKDYIYRCFKKQNGVEIETDCGADLSFAVKTQELLKLANAQYQEEGNIQYWCLDQDSFGNWEKVSCDGVPKVPLARQGVMRVQVFSGNKSLTNNLESGKYRHQKIGSEDFIYRCFRRQNGQEEEIDCGENFSFSSVNIPWVLDQSGVQQEGDIRYACLEPDPEGKLRRANCQNIPKITVKTQIIKTSWGRNDTHYWNDTGVFFIGPKFHISKVQVFQGGEDLRQQLEGGLYRRQNIGGRDFIYRCFRRINGREQEVDCGPNFEFHNVDIDALIESVRMQQDGRIRYTCLAPDNTGSLRSTDCGLIPALRLKTTNFWKSNGTHYWNDTGVFFTGPKLHISKVQVFQGGEDLRQQLEGGVYRQQNIGGRDFIYRCFRRINGREQETDCGPNFEFHNVDIAALIESVRMQQDGRIRYTCLAPDNTGSLRSTDCGLIPALRFKTTVTTSFWKSNGTHYWNNTGVYTLPQVYNFDVVQILIGGEELLSQLRGSYTFGRVESQSFLYRCFKNYQEMQCPPNFSLAGINILVLMQRAAIQREENIRYFCLETYNGNWRSADCSRVPKIQLAQQKQSLQIQQQILRRCLKLVDGRWENVDCLSDARFQTGTGTFVEQCFQTVDGNRQPIDCNKVPSGATFTDVYSQYNQGARSQSHDYSSGRSSGQHQQTTNQHNSAHNGNDYRYNSYSGVNRSNQSGSHVEESYEEYEDEYEEERSAPTYRPYSYSSREQIHNRRDPKTYGTYTESTNQGLGHSGIDEAAQGRGFTAGVLDLGTLGTNGNRKGNSRLVGETSWSETREFEIDDNQLGDNVPTSSPKTWRGGRRKRQIIGDNHPSIGKIKEKYPCENLGCVYMRCTIENLQHGKPLTIALRGRLNAKVLRNMKLDKEMQFSSMMLARVHKVPHLMSIENSKIVVQEVETVVKTPEEIKSETVPLWVVVLSAVAGTIILLLIIFLLYKLGFFKRNRPSSAPERQPLNRNGYHHGDEAL